MARTTIPTFASLVAFALVASWWSALVAAHTVITYPGWRGNNLHTNGTNEDETIKPGSLGINYENGSYTFPYGMQWMYPCGGLPTSQNRTKWPISGGAIGVQPGWFSGHSKAFFYINLGVGTEPVNMSHVMIPVFQINGPSNDMYGGQFCLPQVPLPKDIPEVKVGDNATIQVIETAQHGAALYSCVDITFAEPHDVAEVTPDNCKNTTDPDQHITFDLIYATENQNAAASLVLRGVLPVLAALMVGVWLL